MTGTGTEATGVGEPLSDDMTKHARAPEYGPPRGGDRSPMPKNETEDRGSTTT